MPRRLEGQRCLITGGSRGLGRALALAFARHGARVAFTFSKRTDDAEETRKQLAALGCDPLVLQGSVTDAAHATAAVTATVQAFGGLDVLVNNAGINQVLPIALLEERDWDAVMDVNVKGAYLFSRAALRPMLKAKRGHILSIGSFATDRVVEVPVHYAASKGALKGFTEALAKEVGRYGVSVNLLAPGLLDVGMAKQLPPHRVQEFAGMAALQRTGRAEELAELAAWLVSPENTFMTGARVLSDGGL
jgi:NAD(P)-dependent dehydrogenase (short-subunit alcohol dehydrogenase family)